MNTKKLHTKGFSFLLILTIYLIAFAAAALAFMAFPHYHLVLSTFIANVVATLVVWLFGIIFKNSSIYDPYWSVAPIIIIVFWILRIPGLVLSDLLFLIAIVVWGTRLTFNWAIRWKGLGHQDWRYTFFKNKAPQLWFFTNLFGINLMPTIIVYLALLPAYYALGHTIRIPVLAAFGFLVCLGSTLIQFIADRQMDTFKKSASKQHYIDQGLWRYSRHPNYLGEVAFWWGIWLMQLGILFGFWITVIGPLVMTLLFIFISIPLMEKHILALKPDYAQYQNRVPMILPWFRSKKTIEDLKADG